MVMWKVLPPRRLIELHLDLPTSPRRCYYEFSLKGESGTRFSNILI